MKTIATLNAIAAASAATMLPIVTDSALKGIALLGVVAALMLFARTFSSSARHLVWVSAAAGLLVLPVLSATLPRWRVLPNWQAPAATPSPEPHAVTAVAPVETMTDAIPVFAAPAPPTAPESVSSVPEAEGFSLVHAAIGVWAAGAFLLLARLVLGRLRLAARARRCHPVREGELADLADRLRTSLGIRRNVRVLISDRHAMPMTWGTLRPAVLLPAGADAWAADRQHAVLLHELAHIRRADTASQLVVQLACALHWFNPLAWIAARRVDVERERACDDLVLSRGTRPSDYAEHLLQIVSGRHLPSPSGCGAVAMARSSHLEGRLVAILNQKRNRRALTRGMFIACAVAFAALVLPMAMLDAADEAADILPIDAPATPATPAPDEPATEDPAPPLLPHRLKRPHKTPTDDLLETATDIGLAAGERVWTDYGDPAALKLELDKERVRVRRLQEFYTDAHPAIVKAKERVAELEKAVENAQAHRVAMELGVPRELLSDPVPTPASEIAGIGATLKIAASGYPEISGLVDSGPAEKSGAVKVGDRIAAASDGKRGHLIPLQHVKLAKVVRLLRGEPGTFVRLRLLRGEKGVRVLDVTLERQPLQRVLPAPASLGEAEPPVIISRPSLPEIVQPTVPSSPATDPAPRPSATTAPAFPPERPALNITPVPTPGRAKPLRIEAPIVHPPVQESRTTAVIPLEHLDAYQFKMTLDTILDAVPGAKAVAEPQNNALIYIGPSEGLDVLNSLVEELDVPPPSKEHKSSSFERRPGDFARESTAAEPRSRLEFRAPPDADYGSVLEIIDAAGEAGIEGIRIRADDSPAPAPETDSESTPAPDPDEAQRR